MLFKTIGKNPSGQLLKRLQSSPNYRDHSFQNLNPTPMKPDDVSYWKMTKEFFKTHPGTRPLHPFHFDKPILNHPSQTAKITWFGHSSYLLQLDNKAILVDPVFSGSASPFSFMVKAFPGSNDVTTHDLPGIDYLILTHDHYDHLDYSTIKKLKNKVRQVICPLGVSSHLIYWGLKKNIITELDWWQSVELDNNSVTATPARHFSGRGLKRGKTLWSSFVLKTNRYNIYIGGDSGYDGHFQEIGTRFGPFDLAILEAGQYNVMWPLIHMMPEETVQAAIDLKAKVLLPVHWGKFRLGMHPWNEPVKRVIAAANKLNIPVLTPQMGETVAIEAPLNVIPWWEE